MPANPPSPEHPPGRPSKAQARQIALSLRADLDLPEISAAICAHLAGWETFQKAPRVLFYHPLPGEVDLLPLAYQAPEKQWFLPVVTDSRTGQEALTFRRYQADQALQEGPYGICEPAPDAEPLEAPQSDDLLLLPGLGFDERGYRLGYGKGYFDRFLQRLAKDGHGCIPVGIAPQALLQHTLPNDPWDMPVRFLATETGVQATKIDSIMKIEPEEKNGERKRGTPIA